LRPPLTTTNPQIEGRTASMATVPILIALSLLSVATAGAASAPAPAELRARQQAAIAAARSGDTASALRELGVLRELAPEDIPLLHDEIVVLSWAGRDRDATLRASGLNLSRTPAYVLNAAAKSARNLGDGPTAERWYRAAASADAGNADAGAGLALTLADTGRLSEARGLLDSLPAYAQQTTAVRLASAYVNSRQEQYLAAIADYDTVLTRQPGERDALRGKALALRAMLLPDQALAIATAHPGVLTAEETASLQVDALAMDLRFALATEAPPGRPYELLDRVIAGYDAALAGDAGRGKFANRLRSDRLTALVERGRYADAISDYEVMRADGSALPAYVHAAAANAYLALRRPEDALAAVTAGQQFAPADMNLRRQQFYAETEAENYDSAIAIADSMAAEVPPSERMQAEVLAAMARAYADDLASAERRMTEIVNAAPANASARLERGNVYRWRGWPDKAADEYQQVLTADPGWVAARAGMANANMDRQQWQKAENELLDLQQRLPDNGGVRSLGRRWDLHERPEVRIDARWGDSTGETFGSDQYDIEGWLYSPPLANNWRAFVHTYDSWGEFTEGDIDRRRAGAGAEYRGGPLTASAEVNADRSGYDDAGFATAAKYRLSDHWSVGGLLQLNSYSTPLRAHNANIDSDLAGLDLEYRRDESFAAGAGVRFQDFDDGNERTGIFANTRWRAINRPRYKLDVTGYAATSSADDPNAPYFNPDRDYELSIGFDNRWLMYRRYEQTLTHRLGLGAGIYDQESYGSGDAYDSEGIWDIDYELIWTPNDAWELRGGWHRARRTYDGNNEYQEFWRIGIYGRLP
jgi:biofilm PGA synthesis protein PgaA